MAAVFDVEVAIACLAAAAARWCMIHGCLGTSTNFILLACSFTSRLIHIKSS